MDNDGSDDIAVINTLQLLVEANYEGAGKYKPNTNSVRRLRPILQNAPLIQNNRMKASEQFIWVALLDAEHREIVKEFIRRAKPTGCIISVHTWRSLSAAYNRDPDKTAELLNAYTAEQSPTEYINNAILTTADTQMELSPRPPRVINLNLNYDSNVDNSPLFNFLRMLGYEHSYLSVDEFKYEMLAGVDCVPSQITQEVILEALRFKSFPKGITVNDDTIRLRLKEVLENTTVPFMFTDETIDNLENLVNPVMYINIRSFGHRFAELFGSKPEANPIIQYCIIRHTTRHEFPHVLLGDPMITLMIPHMEEPLSGDRQSYISIWCVAPNSSRNRARNAGFVEFVDTEWISVEEIVRLIQIPRLQITAFIGDDEGCFATLLQRPNKVISVKSIKVETSAFFRNVEF